MESTNNIFFLHVHVVHVCLCCLVFFNVMGNIDTSHEIESSIKTL
jgi:hypothetical protein